MWQQRPNHQETKQLWCWGRFVSFQFSSQTWEKEGNQEVWEEGTQRHTDFFDVHQSLIVCTAASFRLTDHYENLSHFPDTNSNRRHHNSLQNIWKRLITLDEDATMETKSVSCAAWICAVKVSLDLTTWCQHVIQVYCNNKSKIPFNNT